MQAENTESSEHPLRNKYIRSELTVEQGLPDNVVNAIAQTENGLLWIGTGTGLASFDGVAFHQLRLKVEGLHPLVLLMLFSGLLTEIYGLALTPVRQCFLRPLKTTSIQAR